MHSLARDLWSLATPEPFYETDKMSIFNFIKKLNPRIERSAVAEDLRTTEKECVNAAMPSWAAAEDHFRINKIGSDRVKDFDLLFYRNFDSHGIAWRSKTNNFIIDISRRFNYLHDNIVYVQGQLDKILEKDIIPEGLTAKAAFVVRAASNMSMLTRYALSLLNYIYAAEAEHHDRTLEPGLTISKAEKKYVEDNFIRFVKLFSEYSIPQKDFKKFLTEIPEVYVGSGNEGAVSGFIGNKSVDPFEKYGMSGFVGNPIYRIRLVIAKWQNDRYESAKSKKQQLELRLLWLQMQRDDAKDPSVAKEIERLQTRIEGYDRYLREVEESIAED